MTTSKTFSLVQENKLLMNISVGPNGAADLQSFAHAPECTEEEFVNAKDFVAATIFDYDYPDNEERPSEDTCCKLGEKIATELFVDDYDANLDGIESFILALAAEGVNLNDPRFAAALHTSIEACANNAHTF